MKFFLRSRQFKIFIVVVCVILALNIIAGIIGSSMAPQANIIGAVTAPFVKLGTSIKTAIDDAEERWNKGAELAEENKQLKDEIASLREQLVEYHSAIADNEFYKNYLKLKDENPDFEFCPAAVLSTDPDDIYGGFTLDVGTSQGVSLYAPVITHEGLVGYVTEIGLATCKVTTILSSSVNCGAYDSRTNDAGVVSGNSTDIKDGNTRLFNLPRNCSVAVGDIIVTSGGGIFPKKLVIGTINKVSNDPMTSSLYAVITPAVDFESLKNVMVITSFEGRGNVLVGE